MQDQFKEIDTKEFQFADTVFIRNIESRVFQSIVIKCLVDVADVAFLEGTIMDNILGREGIERIKGIYVEQDEKNHSVAVKIELLIDYGVSIPEKAEEIQSKIVKEISRLTGLHVSSVHVVFKGLIPDLPEEIPEESDSSFPEWSEEKEDAKEYSTKEF